MQKSVDIMNIRQYNRQCFEKHCFRRQLKWIKKILKR